MIAKLRENNASLVKEKGIAGMYSSSGGLD